MQHPNPDHDKAIAADIAADTAADIAAHTAADIAADTPTDIAADTATDTDIATDTDTTTDTATDTVAGSLPMTRRHFVRATVGSGFAAAVLPVTGQTIRTDSSGLTAGEVFIPVGGFKMPAYRAMPAGGTRLPVVLVVSEVFGVHEHIADVARRFAKLGYLAIAPELFIRQGDAQSYGEVSKLMAEVVSQATDQQVLGDLDATAAWAAANGGDAARLGITGFCWGGRTVWMYAAHNPAVKAGVAWYGPLARAYAAGDRTAIAVAAQIELPVLGLYGGADAGIPNDTVEAMRAALKVAGRTRSEIVSYPGIGHAFHADYRPSYNEAAARDGWQRCTAWFKANGVE